TDVVSAKLRAHEVRTIGPVRGRTPGAPAFQPRHGGNADLYAGGYLRHGQGDDAGRIEAAGHANHSGQYLSPDAAPRHGGDWRARRPARFHGLAAIDTDRFRWLPGLESVGNAQTGRGGCRIPLAAGWFAPILVAGNLDRRAACAEFGHRHVPG